MLAEMEAEQEEEHAVKEFQRRLAFNMGQVSCFRTERLL